MHFLQFLKAPAEKLMPHPQISFKSWIYNVDFSNQSYCGWKKLVFRLHEVLLNLEQSWLCDNKRILDHFWRSQKKTDASNQFKSWLHNVDSEFSFFFIKKMFWQLEIKIVKQPIKTNFFFPGTVTFILTKKKYNSESTLYN